MVVAVPHQEDARDFAARLDRTLWADITDGLHPIEVDALSLPKFELSYDGYLNEPLRAMGMDGVFRPGADFTRMSPVGDAICINFVRQKTFVQVDERGTRAAAATAVGFSFVSFTSTPSWVSSSVTIL